MKISPTTEIIRDIKHRQQVSSDYAVSKLLGISRSRMSRYVNGHDDFGDEDLIVKAAELAGKDPALVLVEFYGGLSKSIPARKYWLRLQQMARQAAAPATLLVLMALGVTVAPSPAHANAETALVSACDKLSNDVYYVKLLARFWGNRVESPISPGFS